MTSVHQIPVFELSFVDMQVKNCCDFRALSTAFVSCLLIKKRLNDHCVNSAKLRDCEKGPLEYIDSS